jgi:hypothetical protein
MIDFHLCDGECGCTGQYLLVKPCRVGDAVIIFSVVKKDIVTSDPEIGLLNRASSVDEPLGPCNTAAGTRQSW